MFDIISSLVYRLKKTKLFWIMLIVCALLPVLSGLTINGILISFDADISDIGDSLSSFGVSGSALGYMKNGTEVAADVYLASIITVCIFLCREFTGGTMRNVLLSNKSRGQMFFAYYIVAYLVTMVFVVVDMLFSGIVFGLLFGFADVAFGKIVGALAVILGVDLFTALFVVSAEIMFLFCTRKQGGTIIFSILTCSFLPGLIVIVVTLVEVLALSGGEVIPPEVAGWIPFYQLTLFDPLDIDGQLVGKIVGTMTILSAAFGACGYFSFKNANLK